jgi:homogentisate 1,2-dioxygenase
LPSVTHKPFKASDPKSFEHLNNKFDDENLFEINPNQLRWKPMKLPTDEQQVNFVQGFLTVGGIGQPSCKEGMCIYQYTCNKSMTKEVFSNADGEMLIVPQKGTLYVATECGLLTVPPTSILVIPRGLRFSVEITEASRGWVCEIFNGRFRIPDLGPIGANGLANPRDFEGPTAWYEDRQEEFTVSVWDYF